MNSKFFTVLSFLLLISIVYCEYCPTPEYIIEEFEVPFTSVVNRSNCLLTTFQNGQVFFAYETNDGAEKVYGQSFDQNLNRNGEEFLLSDDGAGTRTQLSAMGSFAQQKHPDGTGDEETVNGNEYFLLGTRRYDNGDSKWKIDLQIVASSGQRVNQRWEVSLGDEDTDPVIICREDNIHCDLFWVSKSGYSEEEIYVQQFNLVDHTASGPLKLASSSNRRNMEPHGVQVPSSNEHVVAFTKYNGGLGDSIHAVVYNFETNSEVTNFQINLLSQYSVQNAKVAILKNVERYMVTWEACGESDKCNIHGAILNYKHSVEISEFVINSDQTGKQHLPSIVAVEQLSAFAVSWLSPAGDSEPEKVITRLIGSVANPTVYLTDAIEINTANGSLPVSAMLSINNNVDHDQYRNEITIGLVSQSLSDNNIKIKCTKIKFPIAESEFQLKDVTIADQGSDFVWKLKTPIYKNYDSTFPILNIRAIQSNGSAIPTYLIYDEFKSQFTLASDNTVPDSGLRICLAYENECFLESKSCFNLQTATIASCSNVITQIGGIEDHSLESNEIFSFHLSGSKYFQKSSSDDQFYYLASLENGNPLPDWINFDPVDLEFWGMAPSGNSGISVKLSVMNQCGYTHSDAFNIDISPPASRCPNTATLIMENTIEDQIVTRGTRFTFAMPADIFRYYDAEDDSNPLQFESENLDDDLSFIVVRPKNSQKGNQNTQVMWAGLINDAIDYSITLTITDECNTTISQIFHLRFPACDCPTYFTYSPETRVSSEDLEEQVSAQMAWDDTNELIIYVFKTSFSGMKDEILSRTFDLNLSPVTTNSHINIYNTNLQDYPHISNIHADMIEYQDISLVVWYAEGGDGNSYGLFGRTIDSTGNPLSDETQLNIETSDIQELPIVVTIGNGYISPRFLTLWQSNNQDSWGFGIYGRTWATDLKPLSNEVLINSATYNHQKYVDASVITLQKKARIFIVWNSMDQDGSKEGIFGKVIDHEFNIVKDEFKVNEETQEDQTEGRVTSLRGTERFIVTWSGNYGTEYNNRIYYKIYDTEGNVIISDKTIEVPTGKSQDNPSISALGDYKFLITWQSDNPIHSGKIVYAQLFDLTGKEINQNSEYGITKNDEDNQNAEVIELRTKNKLALSFEYSAGTEYKTYTRILSSDHPSKGTNMPDQEIIANQKFEIQLPSGMFSDYYGFDEDLVYNLNIKKNSIKVNDMDWLQYDQYNQRLYGMAPKHEFDDLEIEIYCLDKCYSYSTTQFTLSNTFNNQPCSEDMHLNTLKNLINNTNDETLILNTCCNDGVSVKYYVDSSAPTVTFNSYNNINFNLHNNGMCGADPHSITFENRQAAGNSGRLKFINSKYITFQTNSNTYEADQMNTIIFDYLSLELTQNSHLIFYNKVEFRNFDSNLMDSWIVINDNSYVQFSNLQFYDISTLNKENGYLYVNNSQLMLNNFKCTNCLAAVDKTVRQENYLIQIDNNDSQLHKFTGCENLFSLSINSMDYSDQNLLILENCLVTNTLKSKNNKILLTHSNTDATHSFHFLDLINSQFVNQMESKFLLHIHELIYFDNILIDNFNLALNSTNIGLADTDTDNLNQLHNTIRLANTIFTNQIDSKTKAINLTLICESSNEIHNYGQLNFDPNSRLLTNNNHSSASDETTFTNHGTLSFVNDFEIDINNFDCQAGSEIKLNHTNQVFPKLFINYNSNQFEGTINNDFSGYTERQDFGQIIECLIYRNHDDFILNLVENFEIQHNDQFIWKKRIDQQNLTIELIGCPIGEYSLDVQHNCETCDPGTYAGEEGWTSCLNCMMGTFAYTSGLSTCRSCRAGSFNNETRSTRCFDCEPGTYQGEDGKTICEHCSEGYFSNISQATTCKICTAGRYSNAKRSTQCLSCEPGTYQGEDGKAGCDDCLEGYFSGNYEATTCEICTAGSYSNETRSTQCFSCEPGTYQGEDGKTGCDDCLEGYFSGYSEATFCKICTAGSYSKEKRSTQCFSCDPGTYQGEDGQMGCDDCTKGYFSGYSEATFCEICTAGSYSNETRSTQCFSCEPGTYQGEDGKTGCDDCLEGYFSGYSEATFCEICTAGSYSNETRSTQCLICDPGTYQGEDGQSGCDDCLEGFFQENSEATTCEICTAGSYSNANRSTQCFSCDPGTYQDYKGQTRCKDCLEGSFQENSQATICHFCPAGTYGNANKATQCFNCDPGTYQDREGKSICKDCSVGYYQERKRSMSCKICPAGTYGNAERSTACFGCDPGTYQDEAGEMECKNCSAGSFSENSEASSCQICPAGTYGNAEGLSQCVGCQPGTYQGLGGQSICEDCSIGYYQDREQAVSCQICAAGTYGDSTSLTQCFECMPGTYQDVEGRSTCIECGAGSRSSRYGSVNCEYCPYNSYQPDKGNRECEFCPINSITLRNGANNVKECLCDIGLFQDDNTCKPCPSGAVCAKVGLLYPDSRPGYWHSSEEPNTFVECKVFDACPGGKTNACNKELGYTGMNCGECLDSFYKLYNRCEMCTNQTQKLILYLFLFIIFVILIIWLAQKGKNYFGAFSILISFFQILAILPKMNIWPINFTKFLSYLSVVNFNIELLGLECSINLSYIEKWFLIMMLPVFLLLLLILIYVLYYLHSLFVKCVGGTFLSKFPRFITRPGKANTNRYIYIFSVIRFNVSKFFTHGYSKKKLKNLRNIFINVYVANLFLVHLIITLKVLEMFDCKKSGNEKSYLEAAPEIQCYGETWYKILPFAITFSIIYIIGIPAFIVWILWFHASRYGEDIFNSRLSLLCGRYEKEYFYWELFVISRKLFIVFCEIYLTEHPLIQIIVCLIVVLVAILLQSQFTPYNSTTRNMMEFSCLCITQIIFITGMVFISKDVRENTVLFNRLSNFLIFIILLGLIIFGIISLVEMKSRISLKKKKSKKKKLIKDLSKLAQLRQSPEIQFLKKKPQLSLLLNVFATLDKKEIKNIKSFSKSLSSNLLKNFEQNNNYSLDKDSLVNKFVTNWQAHLVPLFIHWYNDKSNSLQKIRAVQLFISFSGFKINLLQNKQSKIIEN
ncbi:insulin-like growth factor binding proteinn-terminal [Anaeramoeba flamelloides]|uniref:Insulin-like growth factor binding proteinn-terminal n=1 Tax=Anaeramoeba flamelloides TaxID=1746091 RepID=A0AAV8AB41_9EUKA|nr:insulin-like growth factor binding proteinn-terminal [Anaeramoeba flamelloides]